MQTPSSYINLLYHIFFPHRTSTGAIIFAHSQTLNTNEWGRYDEEIVIVEEEIAKLCLDIFIFACIRRYIVIVRDVDRHKHYFHGFAVEFVSLFLLVR